MNKVNESFSAFLDGEASELDIQRMLKAMDEQPEQVSRWHEMTRIKAALQDDTVVDVALDWTDAEGALPEPEKNTGRFRLLQGGIAAAVAMVVVTTVNFSLDSEQVPVIATTEVVNEQNTTSLAQQQFEARQQLDLFLKEHAEQASFTTGHVVVPSELNWIEAGE
jgi:sigma-E factor negative regulatory protein RseA